MIEVFAGSTSHSVFFALVDSTTGLPKPAIAYTAVTASYARTRSARVAITPVTLAATTTAWISGGWIEEDATNQPGLYRFDVPDAAFAAGVEEVVVSVVATGCRSEHAKFVISTWNKQVAAIPNVAAGAAGGLPTGDATGKVTLAGVTHTSAVIPTVSTLTGHTPQTGDAFVRIGAAGAGLTALGDTRLANLDATVSSRLATAGYTAPPTSAVIAAAAWDLATTGHTTAGTFGAAMSAAGSAGDPWSTALPGSYGAGSAGNILGNRLDAAVSTRSAFAGGAVASVTGSVGSVTAGVTVTTNNDKAGYSLTTAPPTSAVVAAAVWDLATSGHTAGGTFGAAMGAAGAAGDPWSTSLPGSYIAGTAGNILGNRLDAAVSSRSTFAGGAVSGITGVTFPVNFAVLAITGGGAISLPSPAPSGYGTGGTVVLDSGAAGAGGSATSFTATGASLHAPTNGYTGQNLEFTSGALQGQRRTITAHTVSGSTHTIAFTIGFTGSPGAGDTFIIA